ncbi:MAG: hypothetical protein ACTSP4_00120 [Candidatus Hodarchaeales archaeon]
MRFSLFSTIILALFLSALMMIYAPERSIDLFVRAILIGLKILRIIFIFIIIIVLVILEILEMLFGGVIAFVFDMIFKVEYVPVFNNVIPIAIEIEEGIFGALFGMVVTFATESGARIDVSIPVIDIRVAEMSSEFGDYVDSLVSTFQMVLESFWDDVVEHVWEFGTPGSGGEPQPCLPGEICP